jgi:hypothetical protein
MDMRKFYIVVFSSFKSVGLTNTIIAFAFVLILSGCTPLNQSETFQRPQQQPSVPVEHSVDSQRASPSIYEMSPQEFLNYVKNQPRQPAKYGGPTLLGGRLDGVYVAP